MKKSIFLILVSLIFTLISCGTSEENKPQDKMAVQCSCENCLKAAEIESLGPISLVNSVAVPALEKEFDPKENFINPYPKPCILFGTDFKHQIEKSKPIKDFTGEKFNVFQTNKPIHDRKILARLSQKALTKNEFLLLLDHLISQQPYGEPGMLKTDYWQANVFYVKGPLAGTSAVIVWWDSGMDRWCMNLTDLGFRDSGFRIFSPCS